MKIKRQLVFGAIAGPAILMLAGCGCLLGPAKSAKPGPVAPRQEQAAPRQEPVTLQPEPVAPKKEQAALQREPVTLQPEAAPSTEKKTPRTIQALKPPADKAAPPTGNALPKPAKTRCKVRNYAVAWLHESP